MAHKPNYPAILAAYKEAALLAQSLLDALAGNRTLSQERRLQCMRASDALETAIDLAGSRAAFDLPIKESPNE